MCCSFILGEKSDKTQGSSLTVIAIIVISNFTKQLLKLENFVRMYHNFYFANSFNTIFYLITSFKPFMCLIKSGILSN